MVRDGLTALGLAEICTLVVTAPLVHPEHMAVYHWTGPGWGLFVPSLLDVGLVWGVLFLAVWAARGRVGFWVGVLAVVPWVVAVEWGLLWRVGTPWLAMRMAYGGIAVGVGCLFAWRRSPGEAARWAARLTATIMLFFGVGGILLLGQLGWAAWGARGLNRVGVVRKSEAGRARIVWIVFDELSYRQVYERRFPGLRLPAFDALASEGTVFTRVAPAGIFTDRVMPSLMSGTEVVAVRASTGGGLSVRSGSGWQGFDPGGTVFQDALHAGYGTGVVGWYLPYCRVLGAVLGRCVSSYEIGTKSGMSPGSSVGRNMVRPLEEFAGAVVPGLGSRVEAGRHIADYERLTAAAGEMLDDRSVSFVLLHLPVPHLGGIYRRGTGEMRSDGATYLDNLALADRCLGELRARLERGGTWDSTTLVLMGDHSWRTTGEWKPSSAWTGEEDEASEGGRFDPRPAYVVKLAGQRVGARVEAPFAAIRTRALFDALFRGEIQTAAELSAWVGR